MSKSFLISGAGSGIGQAICVRLAEDGHRLILMGRSRERLEATRAMLSTGGDHQIAPADVGDGQAIHSVLAGCDLPHLDGVVANAGIAGLNEYGPDDRWNAIISTNLTGTYNLVNEALTYLTRRPDSYGHVVIMSSVMAHLGIPGNTAYCASKAGQLGLMRAWAATFARQKILVNAVCPGWVDTDMGRDGIQIGADITGRSFDETFQREMKRVPLRKMSTPGEVANLVHFLMSGAQTSITGQVIDINNGAVMMG